MNCLRRLPLYTVVLFVFLANSSQSQTPPPQRPTRPEKTGQIGRVTDTSGVVPQTSRPGAAAQSRASLEECRGNQECIRKEILRRDSPAILAIIIRDDKGEAVSFGTGFLVRATGVVVTNFHVVKGARHAQALLKNGEIFDIVSVLDYDERRDLAVVYIRAVNLPTVMLGDSDTVETGDHVIAIGNPKGYEHTLSDGVVSARRIMEGTEKIQITVPISPGSSGGPLYNDRGEVIGVTTEGYMSGAQNLNFAVPLKYARPMIDSPMHNTALADFGARTSEPAQPPATNRIAATNRTDKEDERPSAPEGVYSDPKGRFTVQLGPGWGPLKSEHDVFLAGKEKSALVIATRSYMDVKKLCDEAAGIVKEQYGNVKDVGKTMKGKGYQGKLFSGTRQGETVILFVGGVALSSRGIVFIGVLANGNAKDEIMEVADMVDSLR